MAITTYYPTKGLETRTYATYMQAVRDCLNSDENVIKFYDVSELAGSSGELNTYFTLTPKSENLNGMYIKILFENGGSFKMTAFVSSSTSGISSKTVSTNGYKDDIPINIVTGANGTCAIYIGTFSDYVFTVTNEYADIDGNEKKSAVMLVYYTSATNVSTYVYLTGAGYTNISTPYNTGNRSYSDNYIAQPLIYKGLNFSDIYTFDGGQANPPVGKFTFSGKEFLGLTGNFAVKL